MYTKPAMAIPPIAASSHSMAKLKTFQFAEDKDKHSSSGGPPGTMEANKENVNVVEDPPMPSASQSKQRSQTSSQTSALQSRGECPQTPVGRLPLAELIGNAEDALVHGESDTPYERVYWNLSPRSSDQANSLETPAVRRGKKRAHSSSPSSSSPNEASNHFATTKPSFDLQTLQKSLKTPQADPAGDLWSRYSMHDNDKQTPTGPGALTAIDLMNSSSPETPAIHLLGRDGGGLRRTVSCGTQWPTSVAKRRKIHHTSSHEEGNSISTVAEKAGGGQSTTKMSRVSLLVDMVQERLAKPVNKVDVRGPSSSSPLPDIGSFGDDRASSLLQRQQAQAGEHELSPTEKNPPRMRITPRLQSPEEQDQGHDDRESSSDFGDDDIDFELLETVDATIASTTGTGREERGLNASELFMDDEGGGRRDFVQRTSPERHSQTVERGQHVIGPVLISGKGDFNQGFPEQSLGQTTRRSSLPQITGDVDEFDDDDSDLFAADLEDVVAMYDNLQPQHDHQAGDHGAPAGDAERDEIGQPDAEAVQEASFSHTDTKTRELVEVSSSDEFGEDLDFEQVAVECASVAQELQSATPRASLVRTLLLGPHT